MSAAGCRKMAIYGVFLNPWRPWGPKITKEMKEKKVNGLN